MTTTLAAPFGGPIVAGDFDPVPKLGAPMVSLEELVVISLLSWGRAAADDDLPIEGGSRRGWWGDSTRDDGDVFGSRLWLLERSVATPSLVALAEDYAREALGWLLDDGIAVRVDVEVLPLEDGRLGLVVRVWRSLAGAPVEIRYPGLWEAING